MATTWQFASGDNETAMIWTEQVVRDAEKKQFWNQFAHAPDSPGEIRHPNAGKGGGIIRVHTDLEGEEKRGEKIRIHNVGRISGRGIHGDGLLRDTGADISTYTMDVGYDAFAMQARNAGKLAEKRTVLKFRENAKVELASWLRRKVEQGINYHLWGLTAPYNASTVMNCWDTSETSVFGNAVTAYSGTNRQYAGNATSAATLDSGDIMTAQLLTKLETVAFEDMAIPFDPLENDGLVLFLPSRGCEQLQYDEDWRYAQSSNARGASNPLITGAIGTYGNITVVKYNQCPTVQAAADGTGVVARGILCGRDALQMLKVESPTWFEDYEDTRKRRQVISIGGMYGLTPTVFNSTRRNALAIDFYARA